ncbi:MAG: hypothetical protein ABI878_07890 [Acidobacteriota bacterium]
MNINIKKSKKATTYLIIRSIIAVFLISQISFAQVQRTIVNGSLEQPAIAAGSNVRVNEDSSAGWNTTHPIVNGNCTVGTANCRPLEYWSSGFLSVLTASGAGSQWVELNADTTSMIYQSVCMTNGESFTYSYLHRGRSSATVADVMQFRLGIPSALPSGSKPADSYSFPIQQTSTTSNGTVKVTPTGSGTINSPTAAGNGWVSYSGTYTYTGTSQVVNMGFAAVSTAGGDLSVGNFIDNFQINLSPYVEATASSVSGFEGTVSGGGSNTPTSGPAIHLAGTFATPASITVKVTGGTATIGSDYSLSVPFASGNTTNTVVINVPAGVYDGTSAASTFAIPFSTSADNVPEPDETVQFAITGVTGATLASLSGCGTAPIVTQTYTIKNDDFLTAADATVSGQVMVDGRGIGNARVVLTDSKGVTQTHISNPFGYFTFQNVESGGNYVLQANHKIYQFTPRVINVGEDLAGVVLTGQFPPQ